MKKEKITSITDEEYNLIIEELVKRFQDLSFILLEKSIKKRFPKNVIEDYLKDWGIGDTVKITYGLTVIVNDLLQILGRIRRMN